MYIYISERDRIGGLGVEERGSRIGGIPDILAGRFLFPFYPRIQYPGPCINSRIASDRVAD